MSRLRLLTFNIAHARGLSLHQGLRTTKQLCANLVKIAKLIQRLEVDFVALQEIDENSRWSGSFDHLAFLREHTGLPYSAFGINNQGNIVGASQRAGGGEIQATFWQGQMPIDLGLTGAHGSFAFGINERGQIIGSVVDELWRTTAVTWANGQLTSLEDLGSGFASPSGINDEGLIVGMSETKDFASRAVMWDGAHVIDLNSLLTDDQRAAGWALLSAVDVNDSGIIIGQALKNNVSTNFVLTPVPEARTGMMTLLGMALMVGLFWRRKASQALAAD